ncbi:uncharacterized protein LOC122172976 isoform X7 [Chrysemys picta bellii]|uniref:uncharacterized protein LOC122172976 isoform X7 n=1 Tax=Chrysemys picta bellii TaxID=8478 RepID=UPI0032B1C557
MMHHACARWKTVPPFCPESLLVEQEPDTEMLRRDGFIARTQEQLGGDSGGMRSLGSVPAAGSDSQTFGGRLRNRPHFAPDRPVFQKTGKGNGCDGASSGAGDVRGGGGVFHPGAGGSAGPHSESSLQGRHAGELRDGDLAGIPPSQT